MESVRADTIGGFNAFLKDHQNAPGDCSLTLAQFDTEYETLHDFTPVAEVRPLTDATFVPRGGTALLDAIGRTIVDTGAKLAALTEENRPEKVICVILTDGEENSSVEYSKAQIHALIAQQRDLYKWQFLFIGANQDAVTAGVSIGIAADSSLTYAANSRGTQSAFASLSASTRMYRAGAAPAPAFSQADRDEQAEADKKS